MSDEPDSFMLRLLREMRAEIGDMRAELATKADIANLKTDIADLNSEMHSLRADVASDIHTIRKELSDQIVGLRRAVVEYHSSVIGHGVLITDLEARMRRVEQHLELPPIDSH
jgi:chromosome segregation ATPase